MPGPTTEVLNDDLKDLRDGVRADIDRLRESFHKANEPVIRLTTEVAIFKWFVGLGLIALVTNIFGGAWWAGTISANAKSDAVQVADRFRALELSNDQRFKAAELSSDQRFKAAELLNEQRFKAIEVRADDRLKVIDDRFKAADARLDRIDARFDRLEAMLTKALAKP